MSQKPWDEGKQPLLPNEVEVIQGTIHDAEYVKAEGAVVLVIKAYDGTPRPIRLHKSSYTFHGKPHHELPEAEVDREMEKTASMFRKAKGRHYKSHISRT